MEKFHKISLSKIEIYKKEISKYISQLTTLKTNVENMFQKTNFEYFIIKTENILFDLKEIIKYKFDIHQLDPMTYYDLYNIDTQFFPYHKCLKRT